MTNIPPALAKHFLKERKINFAKSKTFFKIREKLVRKKVLLKIQNIFVSNHYSSIVSYLPFLFCVIVISLELHTHLNPLHSHCPNHPLALPCHIMHIIIFLFTGPLYLITLPNGNAEFSSSHPSQTLIDFFRQHLLHPID